MTVPVNEWKRRQELLARATAARAAIREHGVDPLLALSYVVWPTGLIRDAERRQRGA